MDLFEGTMALLQKNHEVKIISSTGSALDEISINYGIKTPAVDMYRRLSPMKDLKSLRNIIKVFRDEIPNMVHSMSPKAGLL